MTAGRQIVCRARAGHGICDETILSRQNCEKSARGLSPDARNICANGPAIWGGCVTRRKHRVESWYFSQKAVTVQGGYGAVFAIQVQV
jgi:hypothetical protein